MTILPFKMGAKQTPPKPKSGPIDPSTIPIPPGIDCPEFRLVWAQWLAYRVELKEPYKTLTAVTMQLQWLNSLGLSLALEVIHETMEREWRGLKYGHDAVTRRSWGQRNLNGNVAGGRPNGPLFPVKGRDAQAQKTLDEDDLVPKD